MSLHKVLKSCFLVIISLSFISCSSLQKNREKIIKQSVYDSEIVCKHLFSDKEINSKEYAECVRDLYKNRKQEKPLWIAASGIFLAGLSFYLSFIIE